MSVAAARHALAGFAAAFFLLCASMLHAAEPVTLRLWPDGPPSAMPAKSEETAKAVKATLAANPEFVSNVTDPTITVFRPAKPNGTSVIVAPGGGFMFLAWKHEGTQVCQWLNSLGVTAALLKYRTPTRDDRPPGMPAYIDRQPFTLPVQDAQRAIGLVRHHAAEWGLDPKRVGLLGFSAGAILSGHVAWDRGPRTYPQKPDLDDPRGPDFLVFVYGGSFLDRNDPSKFREGFSVPADAPPAFLVIASGDMALNPIESAMLYIEYKKRNLPAELHIYAKGAHGFGMNKGKSPVNDWPERCGEWMKSMGWLDAK